MNLPLPKTPLGAYRLSVSAFFFLQGLVFASWACRIPDIKKALELNDADLGSVLFAVPVGQMCAMALSGYLVGRFGSRRMLMAASIFYPAVLVYLGMAASFWELAGGLFLFGVAANMTNISVNTQGVGVERLYRCSIMARFHGLWSLAGFFGALLGAVMVDWRVGTETHFIFIFLLSMVILAVFSRTLLPRDARRSSTQGGGMFRSMDAYVLVIGLIAFGSMVSEGTMFDWSGVYFESVVQPGPGLVQVGYVAFMSTMALEMCIRDSFTADRMVMRFGPVRVLRASGILIAAGLLVSVLFPVFWSATVGFLLVGFGTSSIVPLCYSMAGKSRKMITSVALASVSTIGFLGFLLGPPVIGHIAHASSLRWSFSLIALVGLGTAFVAPYLKKFR